MEIHSNNFFSNMAFVLCVKRAVSFIVAENLSSMHKSYDFPLESDTNFIDLSAIKDIECTCRKTYSNRA